MAEEPHYINGVVGAAEWGKFSRFSGKKSKKTATPLALSREPLPFGGVILGSNPSGVARVNPESLRGTRLIELEISEIMAQLPS
jgi:hypothetical protein